MSDEILDGVVRPGPPPADATRPEVVIRAEDGTVTQAVVRLDDDTLVEVTAPSPVDISPGAFTFDEAPAWGDVQFALAYQARMAAAAHVVDPRSIFRGLTTS